MCLSVLKLDPTQFSSSENTIIGTFRSEDEDDYEYEFSVLSMRVRFAGRRHSGKMTAHAPLFSRVSS